MYGYMYLVQALGLLDEVELQRRQVAAVDVRLRSEFAGLPVAAGSRKGRNADALRLRGDPLRLLQHRLLRTLQSAQFVAQLAIQIGSAPSALLERTSEFLRVHSEPIEILQIQEMSQLRVVYSLYIIYYRPVPVHLVVVAYS